MKAAFATWNNRIAPLFDTARQVLILEKNADGSVARRLLFFNEDSPVRKVLCLLEWGVDTLICGAISQPLVSLLVAYDFRVIDFVAGNVGDVVQAWLQGNIEDPCFAMPGRPGRRPAEEVEEDA